MKIVTHLGTHYYNIGGLLIIYINKAFPLAVIK